MRFKTVKIQNFKGIDQLEITFSKNSNFNLIIGNNGVGKTSILEAMIVSLGAYLSGIDNVKTHHFLRDEIRVEKELLGDGSINIKHITPIIVDSVIEIDGVEHHYRRRKTSLQSSRSTIEPRDVTKYASESIRNKESILPLISYQSISRIASQKREKWNDPFAKEFSREVGYLDCLDEAANQKMLVNWCKRMEQISWQQDKKIAEYEAVKTAVSTFITQMTNQESKIFYDKRTEELVYMTDTDMLPIRNLSSGFRTLIGMVFDIAFRMSLLNPMLKQEVTSLTPGVVLIDEIELHLHPSWQWKVVRALTETFPRVQFIATTHSPIILSSCGKERVIMLSKDTESFSVDYTNTPKGWLVNDVLEQKMDTSDRAPEIEQKLERLRQLATKKYLNQLSEKHKIEYDSLIKELRGLLPETDLAIEFVNLLALEDTLGGRLDEEGCEE